MKFVKAFLAFTPLILFVAWGIYEDVDNYFKEKGSINHHIKNGNDFYSKGELDSAKAAYFKAVRLDEEAIHFFSKEGGRKSFEKDYMGAIEEYSKSIDCLKPNDANDHLNRGIALLQLNQSFETDSMREKLMTMACEDFEFAAAFAADEITFDKANKYVNHCLEDGYLTKSRASK